MRTPRWVKLSSTCGSSSPLADTTPRLGGSSASAENITRLPSDSLRRFLSPGKRNSLNPNMQDLCRLHVYSRSAIFRGEKIAEIHGVSRRASGVSSGASGRRSTAGHRPASSKESSNVEPFVSKYRAAVVDVREGVGVAVELPPPCDCSSCLIAWWSDRYSWEGDLLVVGLTPVDQLPDAPGVLTRYVLGTCAPHDEETGDEVELWSPDALPVHEAGAERVHGHPALAALWPALEALVDSLDSLEDLGA